MNGGEVPGALTLALNLGLRTAPLDSHQSLQQMLPAFVEPAHSLEHVRSLISDPETSGKQLPHCRSVTCTESIIAQKDKHYSFHVY